MTPWRSPDRNSEHQVKHHLMWKFSGVRGSIGMGIENMLAVPPA
jgi:hypothetical protein